MPEGLSSDDQIVAACENVNSNAFIATGRGGVPEDASYILTDPSIWNDFRTLPGTPYNVTNTKEESETITSSYRRETENDTNTLAIVEADTWTANSEGEIVLGAVDTMSHMASQTPNCLAT